MSRANNVRGPTSALTEYLRTAGITPTTIARRVATQQQPAAGPSTDVSEEQGAPEQPNSSSPARGRARRTNNNASGYASDELDEPESPPKKQKLTKAGAAKAKAASKNKKSRDDEIDEDEDAYTALSKSLWTSSKPKPAVGSFATCATCEKQFTVTKYTMASSSSPGYLCHPCAKASGSDPFKKPAVPRKRKAPAEKRTVTHFEHHRVPSLLGLCVQIISRHIDDIEAFGDIGSMNMDAISKALGKNRSLTSENAPLFYGAENLSLTLYDATNLAPAALITLGQLNPNLTRLRLDYCGHITDDVVMAWSNNLPNLSTLELLGPFLVHAPAWVTFFETHQQLETFLITQSPLFDLECVQTLVKSCSLIRQVGLKEIGRMSDEFLEALQQTQGLTYLDISDPAESCTDQGVIDLLSTVGSTLTHLDLSNHRELSDDALRLGVQPNSKSLNTLNLMNLPQLTNIGVSTFFSEWTGHALTTLNMARNCDLASEALQSVLDHSGEALHHLNINGWKEVNNETLASIAKLAPYLKTVDLGWCREVDDFVIRDIIEACKGSLTEVKVWGCNRVQGKWSFDGKKKNVRVHGIESESIRSM